MDPRTEAYLTMLFKWNRTYALTAFKGPDEALELGVKPSLRAAPLLAEGARVLDVGSGGGFPSVPLAIARPDLRFVLAEPSRPKAVFLKEVARALGLALQVETRTAEEFLATAPQPFEAVTVRGVHLRRGLLKRLARALAPGGALLVWTAGERAESYRRWCEEAGLDVRVERGASALAFLAAAVPRGTPCSGRRPPGPG